MKPNIKSNKPLCGSIPDIALAVSFAATSFPTHAGITMKNTTIITLAASQPEVGAGTTGNPEVTGGLAGPSLIYTASGSFYAGDYGAVNLNDGDIGTGIVSQKLQLQAEEQKATFLPPCQRSSLNHSRNQFILSKWCRRSGLICPIQR